MLMGQTLRHQKQLENFICVALLCQQCQCHYMIKAGEETFLCSNAYSVSEAVVAGDWAE